MRLTGSPRPKLTISEADLPSVSVFLGRIEGHEEAWVGTIDQIVAWWLRLTEPIKPEPRPLWPLNSAQRRLVGIGLSLLRRSIHPDDPDRQVLARMLADIESVNARAATNGDEG